MCTQVVNARRGDVNGIWRWIIFQLSVDLRITNPDSEYFQTKQVRHGAIGTFQPGRGIIVIFITTSSSSLVFSSHIWSRHIESFHAPRSQLVLFLLPVLPSPLCLYAPRSQLVLFLLPVLPSPLCLHAPRSQLVLLHLPVLPSPLCLHAPRSQLVLFLLPVLPSPLCLCRISLHLMFGLHIFLYPPSISASIFLSRRPNNISLASPIVSLVFVSYLLFLLLPLSRSSQYSLFP